MESTAPVTREKRQLSRATPAPLEPQLLRARDVARVLAVSESQVRNWQNAGLLREVRLPGIRAVRFSRTEVERLAAEWTDASNR